MELDLQLADFLLPGVMEVTRVIDRYLYKYDKALMSMLYTCLVSENLESCSKSHNDFILDVGT